MEMSGIVGWDEAGPENVKGNVYSKVLRWALSVSRITPHPPPPRLENFYAAFSIKPVAAQQHFGASCFQGNELSLQSMLFKLRCVGLLGFDVLLCMEDFRWPGAACLNSEHETHVFRDLPRSKERKKKKKFLYVPDRCCKQKRLL